MITCVTNPNEKRAHKVTPINMAYTKTIKSKK